MTETEVKLPLLLTTDSKYHSNKYKPKRVSNYQLKDVTDLTIEIGNKSEINLVLDAINVGYLIYPSREFLWTVYKKQSDFDETKSKKLTRNRSQYTNRTHDTLENDFATVRFLNLAAVPIIELGELNLCLNLTVLNLSNNYLVDMWPLARCVNLVRLDLQNNHVGVFLLHKIKNLQ
jgi:hypothetical protein